MSAPAVYFWETNYSVPRSYNAARLAAALQTPIEVLLEPEKNECDPAEAGSQGSPKPNEPALAGKLT